MLDSLLIRTARHARHAAPSMRVPPGDPAYLERARREAEFWSNPPFGAAVIEAGHSPSMKRFTNRSYTGDPGRTWMEDLAARGPFARAAALGCTEGLDEARWLALGGSRELDLYDLSLGALQRSRANLAHRLGRLRWPRRGLRFFRADLNFACLPSSTYDAIWSSSSLHHVTNLEYLAEVVRDALRPGGLFGMHDYVGEKGLVYEPHRLARVNEVFATVPPRFRRIATPIPSPPESDKSPFEAVRSDELLAVMGERLEMVHLGRADALFPLLALLDLEALEREAPEILDAVYAAELAARDEPGARLCSAYAVFRRPL